MRAGAATIAYANGAPLATLCRLGRWRENSPVVLGYIRAVDDWKDHPFRGVLWNLSGTSHAATLS